MKRPSLVQLDRSLSSLQARYAMSAPKSYAAAATLAPSTKYKDLPRLVIPERPSSKYKVHVVSSSNEAQQQSRHFEPNPNKNSENETQANTPRLKTHIQEQQNSSQHFFACPTTRSNTTNPYQIPRTNQKESEYFPSHLNKAPAHITLFHALPHSKLPTIDADIATLAASTRPYHISTGRPFRMRKGVAVLLGAGNEQTESLRQELLFKWTGGQSSADNKNEIWLSKQDARTAGQPHWTVMNKVDEEKKVKKTFGELRRRLCAESEHGKVVGFVLWEYKVGGEWEPVKEYWFNGSTASGESGVEGCFGGKKKGGGGEGDDRGLRCPEVVRKAGDKVREAWKSMKKEVKKGDLD
ncbi:hypothetical protein CC80DRAFT_220579 [Byssothecium circinans]|uniref:Uncharacterized protein n=1 Tax=Byssothecium circinans TaxID=147558 RepID=A0A6A5TJH2_9PLEO|nr:hypothetical protein CC80DRAFT_220579 [Byssothecium circinans]